ncbi:MAG: hypothetical protein ACI4Q6_00150 [Huintestinicola sp.]
MEICIRGVKVKFTFGFFAMWAWLLAADPLLAHMTLAACLMHEAGHAFVLIIANVPIRRLTFCCSGIALKSDHSCKMSFLGEFVMLSAGCLVNFLLSAAAYHTGHRLFGGINLGLVLFNLLPFSSLDGGRIIKLIAERSLPCSDIDGAQKICDILLGTAAAVLFILRGARGECFPAVLGFVLAETLLEKCLHRFGVFAKRWERKNGISKGERKSGLKKSR